MVPALGLCARGPGSQPSHFWPQETVPAGKAVPPQNRSWEGLYSAGPLNPCGCRLWESGSSIRQEADPPAVELLRRGVWAVSPEESRAGTPGGGGGAAKMHAGVGATTDPWGHGPSAPRGHLAVKGPEKHEIERELQSVWEGRGLH